MPKPNRSYPFSWRELAAALLLFSILGAGLWVTFVLGLPS